MYANHPHARNLKWLPLETVINHGPIMERFPWLRESRAGELPGGRTQAEAEGADGFHKGNLAIKCYKVKHGHSTFSEREEKRTRYTSLLPMKPNLIKFPLIRIGTRQAFKYLESSPEM